MTDAEGFAVLLGLIGFVAFVWRGDFPAYLGAR